MPVKAYYHDLNLKNNQILNARLHNVTSAEETTLAGTLVAGDIGLIVYNVTTNKTRSWNGTAFTDVSPDIAGNVIFKGVHANLGTAPAVTVVGSQYVITTAGTLTWAGITFNPSTTVEVGDSVLFISPTEVYVFQTNTTAATTTNVGSISLATQVEVNVGTVGNKAVTPDTLDGWRTNNKLPKTYTASVNLVSGVALTVTHNLALQNQDAFIITTMVGSEQIYCQVTSVNINSLTLTATPAVSSVQVTVIGY